MVKFKTIIKKFGEQGEKTGWTHIIISVEIAQKLMPGNKKSFRVKGLLDDYKIEGVALIPMGGGEFVMALNATMRKGIKKQKGAALMAQLEVDTKPLKPLPEFVECLKDEPAAHKFYFSLPKGHQNYFSKWIESAKTEQTKTKRIAQAVTALSRGWGFTEMVRSMKKERDELMK